MDTVVGPSHTDESCRCGRLPGPDSPSDTMPTALAGFNLGAMLWSAIWALAYGLPGWALTLCAVFLLEALVMLAFDRAASTAPLWVLLGGHFTAAVVHWAVLAWFGSVANSLMWKRTAGATRTKRTGQLAIPQYLAAQRRWLYAGIAFALATATARLAVAPSNVARMAEMASLAGAVFVLGAVGTTTARRRLP